MFSWTIVWNVTSFTQSVCCCLVGSSPLRTRYAVSRYVVFSASSAIGYPRYSRMPLSPSMNVILLLHEAVFMNAGS